MIFICIDLFNYKILFYCKLQIFNTKTSDNIPLEYSNAIITSNWNIFNDEDDGDYEQLDFLIILGSDQVVDEGQEIITTIDPSLLSSSTTSTIDIIEE